MKFRLGVLLTSILTALPCRAEDASYCPSLVSIAGQVTSCAQNSLYLDAAQQCQAKLDLEFNTAQASLKALLHTQDVAAADSQSDVFRRRSADLAAAQATLQSIQESMAHAVFDMQQYGQHFIWPTGISAATVDRLHLRSFLYQFSCFGPNQQVLSKAREAIDRNIDDIDRTAAALGLVSARGQLLGDKLQSTAGGKAASGSAGRTPASAGAPAKVGPPVRDGASDITGTNPSNPNFVP